MAVHAASCQCALAVAVACKGAIRWLCMPPHVSVHWQWLSLASVRYVGCAGRLMQVRIGLGSRLRVYDKMATQVASCKCMYICHNCILQVYDMFSLHAASCKCTLAVAVACKCTIHMLCMLPLSGVHWPWMSLASVQYVGFTCRHMQVWTVDVAAGFKCPIHGCSCRLQVCYGYGFRLQVCISNGLPAANADRL